MILSGGDCVLLYESKDLIHWNQISSFKGNQESHTGMECQTFSDDIFQYTEEREWVLTVRFNDGSPAGGTGMQYFVAIRWSKIYSRFKPRERSLDRLWGKDFYAGMTWSHVIKQKIDDCMG